ncbi:MAG: CoA transferase [Dehalococcoidia bacterium]
MATLALQDLAVLECGTRLSVAMCGRLLTDLGARVTKVEPIEGDPARRAGPFPGDAADPERSGLFAYLNRGKRGVTLDLDTPEGRDSLRRIAGAFDVVIAGGSYAELKRWGVLEEDLRDVKPGLICAAVTPFGLTGPRRDAPDSEIVVTALSGIGYYVPGPMESPGLPPVVPGTHLADFTAGVQAASATMTAVVGRDATGAGRQVDVSEQETFLDSLRMYLCTYAYEGTIHPRGAANQNAIVAGQTGKCTDGYVTGVPGPQAANPAWANLVEAMGRPEWAADERMADPEYRRAHAAEIVARINEWTGSLPKAEVAARLQERHATSLPVNDIDDLLVNEQLAARGYFVPLDHPGLQQARVPASPIRFDGAPIAGNGRAPFLGEHNAEVLVSAAPGAAAAPRTLPGIAPGRGTPLPLAGVRILDLTWWIAGPWATTQMAMMGADVIRLESRARPDSMRNTTPFADGEPGINRSGRWNSHNYTKRSAALNLAKPEGLELAKRLVAKCDIVFENFAAGVLDRMGLDYETLKAINPRVILCSVSVIGRDGPFRHYVGMGPGAIAYSGLSAITGHRGGPHGTIPPFLADYTTAWHAELAMLAALHERDRTGVGRRIELSMVEAQASQLPEPFIDATLNGRIATRKGNDHPFMAPHGYYPCAGNDRWLALSVANGEQWRGLCDVLDGPGHRLSGDPRFAGADGRLQHRDELDAVIGSATSRLDPFALEARLRDAGVPAGVALNPEDVFADPHLREREVFISPPHEEVGPYPMVGLAWKLSGAPPAVWASPSLGQHNAYVYGDLLGMGNAEIEALQASGVVA